MQKITPCLWFDDQAESAAQFYTSVFPNSKITTIFTFSPAVSFVVRCDDQASLDRLNAKLIDGGGSQQPCGWVTDRFGLSWQVVPKVLEELMSGNDPARSSRVMAALIQMKMLDIATLQRAYQG